MPKNIKCHTDKCINPYEIVGHKGKNLRSVSANLKRKFPHLPDNARVCSE